VSSTQPIQKFEERRELHKRDGVHSENKFVAFLAMPVMPVTT